MTIASSLRGTLAAALLASAAFLATPAQAQGQAQRQERPIRLVLNVGLQTLDPVIGPFVTRNFAYMVFDTLVAMDSKGEYRPQMLEGWRISEDGLTWTFVLRPGLEFSDGAPVTAEDCVASLKRWGARDALGRRLMNATKEMRAVDPRTFEIVLSRPFGSVIEALGKPSVQTPFIMPARIAGSTPPGTPVAEIVGSGPFLFLRDEWIPGERAAFVPNPRYRPRDEPADGLAGGKVARASRVEFVTMSDPGLRAAAIQRGEVDYLEYAPTDFIARFGRDRNLVLARARGPAEIIAAISMNHLQPPFDNVLMRRAVQMAMDRPEIIAAEGVPESLMRTDCVTIYGCGTFYASEEGSDLIRDTSLERARALIQQAGYRGERIVYMQPADSALINPIGLVMMDRLKRAGLNLDVQTSDWSSHAQRWIRNATVDQGGWNLLPIIFTGFDVANPLSNFGVGFNCTNIQPWSFCNPDLAKALERFEAEQDPIRRRVIAGEMQRISFEQALLPIGGQFASPAVWRAELRGVIDFGFPVMWNLERAGR
ncbi:ABC transporter substrate-binding protein [Pararoseomonas sp. SCSIO 73927]|uniref:ABC transporter substrate-binding protein n=1 Tax=Pararoseomonas sp. SCSIO 73927 TaxID=3114537 RepID=UPI0030CE15F7